MRPEADMPVPNKEFIIEHMIFHQLLRRYRRLDLEWLYLAVQTALEQQREDIDVGEHLFSVLPDGYSYAGPYCPPYSGRCLPFFAYLYDITIPDDSDGYCTIYFVRRYDQRRVAARLKLQGGPSFRQEFEATKRKLDAAREKILVESRWTDNPFGLTPD